MWLEAAQFPNHDKIIVEKNKFGNYKEHRFFITESMFLYKSF